MSNLVKGYFQVYTGSAKGKTTAALGLAFRAAGHGMKTYIGQFLKGQDYGELRTAKLLTDYITIEQYGNESFIHAQDTPKEEDIKMARKGLVKAREAMLSGEYDIVVFDEINVAYHLNLISLEELMGIINSKPEKVEIIFTGRHAPVEIIKIADLATEMIEVKHYYKDDVKSRVGIEK